MSLRLFAILLVLLVCLGFSGYSQGEIDEGGILFRNERSLGIEINSNGWGVNIRKGKWLNAFKKRIISGSVIIIKDPKEYRENPRTPNYSKFVFGKENSFFAIRGGYGFQKELFSKFDKGGIAINYFYQAGPSIGFLKPIYYKKIVSYNPNEYYFTWVSQKFDKDNIHSPLDILSKDSFLKGLDETRLRMGLYFEIGASFEFSSDDQKLNALEAGLSVDIFHKRVRIMAVEEPSWFFFSLFVSYRFGKIIDARFK